MELSDAILVRALNSFYGDMDRFLSHVSMGPGGCWLWFGPRGRSDQRRRYGTFVDSQGKSWLPYRFRVEWMVRWLLGTEVSGDLHHMCNIPLCVRESHLRSVSRRENLRLAAVDRADPESVYEWRSAHDDGYRGPLVRGLDEFPEFEVPLSDQNRHEALRILRVESGPISSLVS